MNERLAPVRAANADKPWEVIVEIAFFSRIDLTAHGYYIVPTDRCGYDWAKKVIKHKGKQIQGKFSRSAKAKARMRELLADDAVKKEAASTDLDSHSSTILCVLVPLMVAIAAASATMTGTLGH